MFKKLIILMLLLGVTVPIFGQSLDTAWVRRYNGPGSNWDELFGMTLDASGNVYVTGFSVDDAVCDFDFATIKYHPNGDTAWVRRYNGPANQDDGGYAVTVDSHGNVNVTGRSDPNSPFCEIVTIKYYPDGDTAWVKNHKEEPPYSYNVPHAIAVDDLGNVYVATESWYDTHPSDYVTIKYYADGETAWVRRYEGGYFDIPYSMALDSFGNILITGSGGTLKDDSEGNLLWVGAWIEADIGRGMVLDASGNVYVAGRRTNMYPRGDHDFLLLKYHPSGDTAWVRTYDSPGNGDDVANKIAIDRFQNVYVAGYTQLPDSSYDAVLIKYYSNGDSAWSRTYNGTGNGNDWASFIALDSSGNIYISGTSEGTGTYRDYVTIKYYAFIHGDTNGNRNITISDVVYLINYLFKGGPTPVPKEEGDANCDAKVSVSDAVYLINYLIRSGQAPCI